MALDEGRRAALLVAKLTALASGQGVDVGDASPHTFPGGVALRAGSEGWFYAEASPRRGLGPALAWQRSAGVDELSLVVDDAAGELARRAQAFDPPPRVWEVVGDQLAAADPAPLVDQLEPPAGLEVLVDLLEAVGADVVVEHGDVVGELAGLEIARVVVDDDQPRLEVGVGRHDREAFAQIHGDLPTPDALAAVVDAVRQHRRPGAPAHPLNRLAAARWLRARTIADPSSLGLRELRPVPLTFPRASVKEEHPAAAVGRDTDDRRVVAVFSVGVDLDVVPVAADVRQAVERADGPVDELLVVVPERDALSVLRWTAEEALRVPARVVTVPDDWRG